MKRLIKRLIMFFEHPIIFIYYLISGNNTFLLGAGSKMKSLKDIIIGKGVAIGKDARFLCVHEYQGGIYTPQIIIGNNVSITNRFTVLSAATVEIGDNSLIASDVFITSENHGLNPLESESYTTTQLDAKSVKIGKGCFIGEKVCIMPGVELGDRCVVAAGSVVTKCFPAYSMVGGVPAKTIKKFDIEKSEWKKVYD